MPEAQCTILGGLPVIAEVWFSYEDGGVDSLHWIKKDGTKGGEVSQKVYDRLDKYDQYWSADVLEQVSESLAHEQYERERMEKEEPPELIS